MANLEKIKLNEDPFPFVPQSLNQLGIFLLDGSASMLGVGRGGLKKHQEVNLAVRESLGRLKRSTLRNCFSFAVVVFGIDAAIHTPITPADDIDDNGSFDPLEPEIVNGAGTFIGAGLVKCNDLITEFFANRIAGIPNKVAIVILSDGMSEGNRTKEIAGKLKQTENVEVYCCHLEVPESGNVEVGATELLQSIATDPV
ncbi:MAG: hypothetical protein RLZZ519_941, partial [Bacteroidota bacterium]